MIQNEPSDDAIREGEPPLPAPRSRPVPPNANSFRGPIFSALIHSVIVTVISVLVLDMGETARVSAIGLAIFWGWAFFAMWRRSANPTEVDLCVIRWGCIPFIIGFQMVISFVWRLRGLS